ncbi:MAG: cytochrome c family protein [Desulfofustis sp.]|nr:cytochrome c family protein [Desulfofustis sp.]
MQKIKVLTILFVGTLLVWGPISSQAMDKEADTIDELVSMFGESTCMDCHDEIHDQWSQSWHAQSVVSSLGSIHNFIEIGIKKEWESEVTKAHLLKCLDCHAPVINYASENLAESDPEKQVMFADQKKYFEIGRDMEGRMRYGAWQIKEIVDLTLQPLETKKEEFLMNFDTDVEEVEIEAVLTYFVSGKKKDVVYSIKENIAFDIY